MARTGAPIAGAQVRHLPEDGSHRASWLEIDLSRVERNARRVCELVGPACQLIAVVKADGYGLGASYTGRAAIAGGATCLAVACVDEGVRLRKSGISVPIIIMGYAAPEEMPAVVRNDLTLVVASTATASALEEAAGEAGRAEGSVAVHIKVDTGMHRYGCMPEEFFPLVSFIKKECPHLRLRGLMTHLATADSENLSFAREQLALFDSIRADAEPKGIHFEMTHAANSAATLALPESRYDAVRVGIMLTGNLPAPHLRGKLEIENVVTLKALLARVMKLKAGESVGYGRTWKADRPSIVGLVPTGYADGYRRLLSNRAEVLVNGKRCPVVGRVSMDQITVDLTEAGDVGVGTEVVLAGEQGGEYISFDALASSAETISYEILTGLSPRLPRLYFRDGQLVARCDLLAYDDAKEGDGQ